MKKQTVYTLLIIVVVLAFFVTPLGDYSKLALNRLFAPSPTVISAENASKIADYDWKLKDPDWKFFNFETSRGKVVVISFWRSWHLPSRAQIKDLIQLHQKYKGQVDFYFITNEEKEPVEAFMTKNDYNFPITYEIIGSKTPVEILDPPGSYVLDKKGFIRIRQTDISDWDNSSVHEFIDQLLVE